MAASDNKFFDVAKPGKTPPPSSARPIIVTDRPMLQDPMVSPKEPAEEKPLTKTEKKVEPPEEEKPEAAITTDVADEAKETEKPAEVSAEPETSEPKANPDSSPSEPQTKTKEAEKLEVTAETKEQEAHINQLINEKKYFVPIGEVMSRRNNKVMLIIAIAVILIALAVAKFMMQ